jgi:hypothetical protein
MGDIRRALQRIDDLDSLWAGHILICNLEDK